MRKYRLITLLLPLLLFSCGLNNTMYNARKYFTAAQARPLNANGRATPQAVEDYTKAIKKCGIILSREKPGRNTDDALFLMARALYYKGNSAFQAKDQFEALISGFPESPFYGEAHIYLARVLREINRKEEAENLLEEFVLDPQHAKLHPRALLTLAEFEIADQDYTRALYWLEKIVSGYPKSDEYREAFFQFGRYYFVLGDYESSLREFQKIAANRRIPQNQKLEARYYIGLNQFLLGDHNASWATVQKLLKDENRPDKLAQARVLKGCLLFARGQGDEGIAEMEEISRSYPRTQSSAEAQYHLAEYLFLIRSDLDLAAAAYTKVRSEFSTSELAEPATRKSAAITQLRQRSSLNQEGNLQQFVDYHVTAAENYFSQFALPDSALGMYQRFIDSRDSVAVLRDSLLLRIEAQRGLIDSLTIQLELLPEPVAEEPVEATEPPDTSAVSDITALPDSLLPPGELTGTEISLPDSLEIAVESGDEQEGTLPDSLEIALEKGEEEARDLPVALDAALGEEEGGIALPESLFIADHGQTEPQLPDSLALAEVSEEPEPPPDPAEQRRLLDQRLISLQTELSALETRVANLEGILQRYDLELVPLALFSQASIHSKTDADSSRVQAIHARMEEEFPGNKYTNALGAILSGAPVRIIDPEEEAQELRLDQALGLAEAQPDSMLAVLGELAESVYTPIRLRSNFRLGWYYSFEAPDTTAAKPYLEEVLNLQQEGEFKDLTTRFFDGTHFMLGTFDKLVATLEEADRIRILEEQRLAAEADSLKRLEDERAIADSLAPPSDLETIPDSLAIEADSTAVPDSLSEAGEEGFMAPEGEGPELEGGSETEAESPETPERKEDPPPQSEPEEPLEDVPPLQPPAPDEPSE
ncbi:MAG: tetratricopeptide repeat protein [Candidatus Syntrophosphaera sp.]|nr:tetratricopeptide repeat protein [Candidatus Syntrophosphaera sp.]